MYSISFPNIFSNRIKTNLVKDSTATLSNLYLLLNSDKLTLFGDPYFGTSLKKAVFEQNNYILLDMLIDEIYTVIKTFMPQIALERKNISITIDNTDVIAKITCTDLTDYTTNMYSINLTTNLNGNME